MALRQVRGGGWGRDSLKIKTEGMANRGIFANKKN